MPESLWTYPAHWLVLYPPNKQLRLIFADSILARFCCNDYVKAPVLSLYENCNSDHIPTKDLPKDITPVANEQIGQYLTKSIFFDSISLF